MEKYYKCLKCGKTSDYKSWNESTIEDLIGSNDSHKNIEEIQDIDVSDTSINLYYTCPECIETCYIDDGHIEEVVY